MSAWIFKPRLIPTLAVIILFPSLLALGFWQIDRADQKVARYTKFQERRKLPPLDLNSAAPSLKDPADALWRRVTLQGIYDGTHYLLDNQILNGDAGYYVYTPFRLVPGETRVLVNRGWVPIGADRSQVPRLPTPSGMLRLTGVIKTPPPPNMLLSRDIWEDLGGGVARVQDIDMTALAKHAGHALLPFVVRLGPASATGFARHWVDPGSGKEMHLGYAFQWFLLSAVLIVIYLAVNLKKKPQRHD